MEVTIGLLADCANKSDVGKLNVMGVFERIRVPSVPTIYPHLTMILRFDCTSTEFKQQKTLKIYYRDQDGKLIKTVTAGFKMDGPEGTASAHAYNIFEFNSLPLPHFGVFEFVIEVNGETKKEIPLIVAESGNGS